MMIRQIEHKYSEEHIMESTTVNKKNTARTICAIIGGIIHPGCGNTEIFIYPGYKFKAIDCLITNFHLPESTLLMLVSALAGKEHIMAAYKEAVKERYRFFSFGDAMFIQ